MPTGERLNEFSESGEVKEQFTRIKLAKKEILSLPLLRIKTKRQQ
jgi:hypothetical protein